MDTTPMPLEEGMKKIEDAIRRKKMIFDDQGMRRFTPAENMEIYNCVYKMCTQKPPKDYSDQIYDKYMSHLEERIMEKVIPRLLGKHGAALLTEVTQSWLEFKAFADSLYMLFEYLDRYYVPRRGLPTLVDAPRRLFCDQVCERLYGKIQKAAMSLIVQDREGKAIDRKLLRAVLDFFLELGSNGTTNSYEKFERIMLAEAAVYYSELSMEWWFWRDSYTNYLRKVDWCLVQEEARAEIFPKQTTTKTKLLEVVRYILLERNAKRLAEMRLAEMPKANGVRAEEDEELVSKYASLSLDVDSSASVAMTAEHR